MKNLILIFLTAVTFNINAQLYTSQDKVNISKNELGYDAWGRAKTVKDKSIFHAIFTYGVPVEHWYERINEIESTSFTNCMSIDGELVVNAGSTLNDKTNLRTFRNPRYEPNRGHLYSTAGFIDNPNAQMSRSFGVGTAESGVFFNVNTGQGYGIIRTTRQGTVFEDTVILDLTGVDLSKGNVYDLQWQWRGVGNYKFFINLKEVGSFDYLGTLNNLSMFNPACPLFFESVNLGDNESMRFGCVDVTSEGGEDEGKTYGSISISTNTAEADFTGYNQPIIVIKINKTVNGLINTRDILFLGAVGYADEKCILRVWNTRDSTAITQGNSVWTDFGDGHIEYLERSVTGSTMSLNTAKANLTFSSRVPKENSYTTSALFQKEVKIYGTPGDYLIITIHRETGAATKGGATLEIGQEI